MIGYFVSYCVGYRDGDTAFRSRNIYRPRPISGMNDIDEIERELGGSHGSQGTTVDILYWRRWDEG